MTVRKLWREDHAALASLQQRLAPWIYEASIPFADWYFGDPQLAAEIVAEWMQRPESELYLGRAVLLSDALGAPEGLVIWLRGAALSAARAVDFAAFLTDLGRGADADAVAEEVATGARALFPAVAGDAAYISRVVVDPARRGQKIGRRLMQETLDVLRDEGETHVRLDVSDDNARAIALYERVGFTTQSTSSHAESGLCYRAMSLRL